MAVNEKYWEARSKALAKRTQKSEDDVVKELGQIYKDATKELEKDLQAFYGKYADDTGLSLDMAKHKISKADMKDFAQKITNFIAKGKDITDDEIEQWRLLRAKFNVTRLDLLINEMDMQLIQTYGKAQITMDEHLKTVAAETYYAQAGIVGSFAKLPIGEVTSIVTYPWSGAEFSDLLWAHKEKLVRSLRKVTTTGFIRGDGVAVMARNLRKEVASSVYASERLIRTETNAIATQSTLKAYSDNGLTKYKWKANIDGKVDDECEHLDGKVYEISKMVIGLTAPPRHPNCRCYILPVVD